MTKSHQIRKYHRLQTLLMILTAIAAAAGASRAFAADALEVQIAGLRDSSGVMRCGLFAKPENFPKGKVFRATPAQIQNQQSTCVFANLPPGRYAVVAFHASHNEKKMPRSLLGVPQEGYGFSNNPAASFGPPSFDAASFNYSGGEKALTINLNYR